MEISGVLLDEENSEYENLALKISSFNFIAYNPLYSQIIIWTRFCCLLISFAVCCFYANSLRRFHFEEWTVEQKWTAALSLSLLFMNNPTFPLQFLVRCWWISYADQLL